MGDRLEQPHGVTVVTCVTRGEAKSVRAFEGVVSKSPGRDRMFAWIAVFVSIAVLIVGKPMAGVGMGGLIPFLAFAFFAPLVVALMFWMRASQRRQMIEVTLEDGSTKRILLEAFCDAKRRDEVARELNDRGWPLDFR